MYKEVQYQHISGSSIRTSNSRYFNKSYLVLKNFGLPVYFKNVIKTLLMFLYDFSLPKQRDNLRKINIQLNLLKNMKYVNSRKKLNFLSEDKNIIEEENINKKVIRFYLEKLEKIDKKNSENANKTAFVYITNRCNAKCEHCFYWDELNKNVDEMSLDDYKVLANNFKNDVNQVIITGGEPFLRKEIDQIFKIFFK